MCRQSIQVVCTNHCSELQGPMANWLFFKAIKQNLKIKPFVSTCRNCSIDPNLDKFRALQIDSEKGNIV